MNSIGFENFRRFAKFPSIDLGDVTILVGGNNSGKSTIVKALLLCVDNLRLMTMNDRRRTELNSPLSFTKPIFRFDANEYHDAKVKTFKRAIHNRQVSYFDPNTLEDRFGWPNTMVFKFQIAHFIFTFNVAGDLDENFTTGDVTSITIEDTKAQIRFSAHYESHTMTYEVLNPDGQRELSLIQNLAKLYYIASKDLQKAKADGDLDAIVARTKQLDKISSQISAMSNDEDHDGSTEITEEKLMSILRGVWKNNKPVKAAYDMPLAIFHEEVYEPVVLNVVSSLMNYVQTRDLQPKERPGQDPSEFSAELQNWITMSEYKEAIKQDLDAIQQSHDELSHILYNYVGIFS